MLVEPKPIKLEVKETTPLPLYIDMTDEPIILTIKENGEDVQHHG